MPSPLELVVLISGGGTTLENLVRQIASGRLDARIRGVLSSHPQARGLSIAARAGISTTVIERSGRSLEDFSLAVFDYCRSHAPHYVAMGGFLKRVLIPRDFQDRVLNIHPSLIPAFCGQGFYGHRVHAGVLAYGAKLSGCTVHFVDDQYDHGPILLQQAVPVLDDDTPDTLAARVFSVECQLYPEALRLLAAERVRIEGRRVRILPAS